MTSCCGLARIDVTNDNDWRIEKYEVAYNREQARERVRMGLSNDCSKDVAERIARWL